MWTIENIGAKEQTESPGGSCTVALREARVLSHKRGGVASCCVSQLQSGDLVPSVIRPRGFHPHNVSSSSWLTMQINNKMSLNKYILHTQISVLESKISYFTWEISNYKLCNPKDRQFHYKISLIAISSLGFHLNRAKLQLQEASKKTQR